MVTTLTSKICISSLLMLIKKKNMWGRNPNMTKKKLNKYVSLSVL